MNENTMNNDVTMRPQAGTSLGRIDQYELIRELGGGGFGCVYLARDTVAGIEVAVKGLPPLVRLNKEELENVKRNFALVSRLHHPNIAAALHFQKVQSAVYNDDDVKEKLRVYKDDPLVVMQYAPGVTLSQWRKQFLDGKVPLDKALEITRQIASALDYAHKEKILHRDIKPANVMIETEADGKIIARVLDFGLAAEIRSSMSRVSQSITDTSGTRPYMAPEQWLGREQGKETDLYALAVLFNELVTGKVPFASVFDTGDPVLMMNVVGREEPEISSDLPKPIRLALAKALAKKREDRFDSCITFVDALGGHGVLTAPCGNAFGKNAVISLLVLGLAFGGIWYWQVIRENELVPPDVEVGIDTPSSPLPPSGPTELDIIEIKLEASVQEKRIERIEDADGFKVRKGGLSEILTNANTYCELKQWADAALSFTNYVEDCKSLVNLDAERQVAKRKRKETTEAWKRAELGDSAKYASARWLAACDVMKDAEKRFQKMDFVEAQRFYKMAFSEFEVCVSEAKTEQKRLELLQKEQVERENLERIRRANWRKEGESYTIELNSLDLTMKWCPAGTFMMGSPSEEEGRDSCETQHKVILRKGFWIGQTEVTQGQWKKIMDGETVIDLARKGLYDDALCCTKNGRSITLREFWEMNYTSDPNNRCGDLIDTYPVYNLSWYDAVEFCKRLTKLENSAGLIPDGYEYRLPTEAEWEYACRAGSTTSLPNGFDMSIFGERNALALDHIAWYGGNSSDGFTANARGVDTSNWKEKQYPGGRSFTREVMGKEANDWGLYDMIGNVWEWCYDFNGWLSHVDVEDPIGPSVGTARIIRGGAWDAKASYCRSAKRCAEYPNFRSYNIGFRVVLAPTYSEIKYPDAPVINVPEQNRFHENKRLAIEAFKAKRYDEAYRLFMKSDLEDREVQYFMGHLYESGHGVLRNEFEAVKWFRKAAEQGHLSAQVFLGMRYANGQGVVKDEYEAIKWFRKAADLGDVFSFYKLGEMYENGSGVLRDIEEAKKWYRKAAERGHKNAKEALERLENVSVVQPVRYVQPVVNQPQQPELIDRPHNLKYCDNCGHALWRYKKISPRCEKCGTILFKPEAPQKDTTGKDVEALGNLLRGIGGGL